MFENRVGNKNHWVFLRLVGTTANHEAIGARVTLRAGGVTQIREVKAEARHQSTRWVHFGLGPNTTIESLTVRWGSAAPETIAGASGDSRFTVVQGSGKVALIVRGSRCWPQHRFDEDPAQRPPRKSALLADHLHERERASAPDGPSISESSTSPCGPNSRATDTASWKYIGSAQRQAARSVPSARAARRSGVTPVESAPGRACGTECARADRSARSPSGGSAAVPGARRYSSTSRTRAAASCMPVRSAVSCSTVS
ncbi:MAG: ASPIC/UnbV domain-containing protein [Myxococcales bacterium]|nr:ASPIC/UnbV domain-containing protein [Myxococcales bacterium]